MVTWASTLLPGPQSVSASVCCVVFLYLAWQMKHGFPTLTQTADSPTSSFCQTKVEEGRRRKGAGESFHHSDLWSIWLYAPATCSRKELKSAVSMKVDIMVNMIIIIRSKNVLDEYWVCKQELYSWNQVNIMDNIRLEHGQWRMKKHRAVLTTAALAAFPSKPHFQTVSKHDCLGCLVTCTNRRFSNSPVKRERQRERVSKRWALYFK